MQTTASCILIFISCTWQHVSGKHGRCKESSPSFNACLENTLNTLIPTLKHGWTNGDVPGLDPIAVPAVNTSQVNDAMDISLSTKDVIITGMSNARVHAVKTKNLFMGKLEVVLKVPVLEITGSYSTEGEMATFPLSSSGRFNITMDDVTIVCILYMDRFVIGNEGRLVVSSLSLDAVPGQIHIKPAPYLDDDDNLGNMLEVYLNQNAYELYNMVKPSLMNNMSDLARIMIDSYLSQVPVNEKIKN